METVCQVQTYMKKATIKKIVACAYLLHARGLKGIKPAPGGSVDGGNQASRAVIARWVISSTEPMPLMARYLGAAAGSCLAQLL